MDEDLVHVDRSQSGVAVVSMQRAEKRNALNIALVQKLIEVIEQLEGEASCRVLILRGEGIVFCSGLDLAESDNPDVAEKSAENIRRLLSLVRESPLVVIGAAIGAAYAGGAGLLAACDLVVCDDGFRLGFPEVRRGLVAAMVWGILGRKVRNGDLRELLLLGEPVTALRAQQMGLVQWIVPGEQVLEQARIISRKILSGGPEAVRETKQLLNQDPESIDFHSLQALHQRMRQGVEAREGLAAFRERREPNWCTSH